MSSLCFFLGFIGLSVPPLFLDNEALKISVARSCSLCRQIARSHFQNVLYSLSGKTWNWLKTRMLLASPPSPSHYIAFIKLEVVTGEDQMQYFSQTTGGTTCQWSGEVAEDLQLQGLLSLCCNVVPLRDSDLVKTFNAASFCVAFFSSLLYMEKLIHLVNVIIYNYNSNNNDDDL